jgi:hypothetical protein
MFGEAGAGGLDLGAPGVYLLPPVTPPVLGVEPLDVAAFVGVAPRGPAWEPLDDPTLAERGITRARSVAVAVDGFDAYRELFGGFEGPGLLPHAVAAFFAQGGRRAFVVRIVHDEVARDPDGRMQPLGCAEHDLGLPPDPAAPAAPVEATDQPVQAVGGGLVRVRARNEGSWGGRLELTLSATARPVAVEPARPDRPDGLVLAAGAVVPAGSVLRVRDAAGASVLRRVVRVERQGRPGSTAVDTVAVLDSPAGFVPAGAEEILAELAVVDRDPRQPRSETFARLGLHPDHPRWLAREVTAHSRLVEVVGRVTGPPAAPVVSPLTGIEWRDATLPPVRSHRTAAGEDRWAAVTPSDVFGRLLDGDDAGTDGLDALLHAPEVAAVVVPDLYSPAPVPVREAVDESGVFAGPAFAPCLRRPALRHPAAPVTGLTGLVLDPADPAQLDLVVHWQRRLVAVAERLRVVALLDVPPGLRRRSILRWRARFDSSFAAAYHPWLRSPLADPGSALVDLPPSAVAAGIIARTELRSGVPRGPANEPAAGVVDVLDRVDDARHGELHAHGVDVFRRRPDAVWLTGARTLSTERDLRQLTVRRLLLLVERAVARQLLWTVFEPNDPGLRAGLRRMLDHLLGDLFARGAFAGATPAQSWFVHVATGADAAREADRGQVVVEVGVAPAEPTEFILVRVMLDADGGVTTRTAPAAGVPVHG